MLRSRPTLRTIENLKQWLREMRAQPDKWMSPFWQRRNSLYAADLIELGILTEVEQAVAERYPVVVNPYMLSLVDWDDPADPIRRQWQPSAQELDSPPFEDANEDPFSEHGSTPIPGVVQRFPDRILLMVAVQCPMRCRHCFRKNGLDSGSVAPPPNDETLERIVEFLKERPKVREVLLSGGDPLMLNDQQILRWVDALTPLEQLDAVRIGSRVPCTMPMRITPELAQALGKSGKVWLNTHFNHLREITPESTAACRYLVEAGIPVSNQSVLLKGVNDNVDTMEALCCGLQRIRVRPYYVFVCDPVVGTQHFRTSVAEARAIEMELATRVGGLALPRFVVDKPAAPAKQPVSTEVNLPE